MGKLIPRDWVLENLFFDVDKAGRAGGGCCSGSAVQGLR